MRDDLTPWNLETTFTVSYNTVSDSKFRLIRIISLWENLGVCHTIQKTYKLPLKLVARSIQQLPSAATAGQCKITLGANKPVVDLNTLFPGRIIHFEEENKNIEELIFFCLQNLLQEIVINKV